MDDLALLELTEEAVGGRELDLRQPVQVVLAVEQLEVDLARSPAAVARPVHEQRRVEVALRVVTHPAQQAVGGRAAVVVALRWHVDEHARAVDALPGEGAVRKVVDLVPRQLDGLEPVHARLAQDLREVAVVAERVRQPAQPHLLGGDAELVGPEPAADEGLAHEGLAAGQVGVGLDPERALRFDAPGGDRVLDPRVQGRLLLLHPPQLLGLAGAVDVPGPRLDRVERAHVRPCRLPPRLAQGPQPRHVEVPVTDGRVRELARRGVRQRLGEDTPCAADAPRGEAPVRVAQDGAEAGSESRVVGRCGQHQQRQVVVVEPVRLVVARHDPGPVEGGPADVVQEQTVVRDVGVEVDHTVGQVQVGDVAVRPAGVRQVALDPHGGDGVDHLSGRRVDQPFAADAQLDDRVGDTGGDRPSDVQPRAVVLLAPLRPSHDGLEQVRLQGGERQGLPRPDDLCGELGDGRVDGVPETTQPQILTRFVGHHAEQELAPVHVALRPGAQVGHAPAPRPDSTCGLTSSVRCATIERRSGAAPRRLSWGPRARSPVDDGIGKACDCL